MFFSLNMSPLSESDCREGRRERLERGSFTHILQRKEEVKIRVEEEKGEYAAAAI